MQLSKSGSSSDEGVGVGGCIPCMPPVSLGSTRADLDKALTFCLTPALRLCGEADLDPKPAACLPPALL
eukprot:648766-Hanusia_phi.AAC.1